MSIRKLIKDGLIMRRLRTIHSRSRARRFLEAKRRGDYLILIIFFRKTHWNRKKKRYKRSKNALKSTLD